MSVLKGDKLTVSIEGASHAQSIGVTMEGFPANFRIDLMLLQNFLTRRAPGNSEYQTPRRESDQPIFKSGLNGNLTNGEPIKAIILNKNANSKDYSLLKKMPRPGHADYTAHVKYKGHEDYRGGGAFSGRMTAPLCIAGGLCKQFLESQNIHITTKIHSIHGNSSDFLSEIKKAKLQKDSVGGIISCTVSGLRAGLGGSLFDGIEGKISNLVFAIPSVKGIEFGAGFKSATLYGSENNDEFYYDELGEVRTRTNNSGGILGGISDGMDVTFNVVLKPTPSIEKKQKTILYESRQQTEISIKGRHDPCIVPRALPCVEAAAAIALTDMFLADSEFRKVQNKAPISKADEASPEAFDIETYRNEIDRIDRQILKLFEARMHVAENIAAFKKNNKKDIVDKSRETKLIKKLADQASPDLWEIDEKLFRTIIKLSCEHQSELID